jgi:hypothetical protein
MKRLLKNLTDDPLGPEADDLVTLLTPVLGQNLLNLVPDGEHGTAQDVVGAGASLETARAEPAATSIPSPKRFFFCELTILNLG